MSDALSVILSNTDGLKDEDFKDLSQENQSMMRYEKETKFQEAPREVTAKVMTPEILGKINRLFQLVGHHQDLIANTSVTLSIAQEIFAELPLEDQTVPNKCTKLPSKVNYVNILEILEKSIEASTEELSFSVGKATEIMLEKLAILYETNIARKLVSEYEAFYSVNKQQIQKLLTEPHNVYTKSKEFIKIDLEPLKNLSNIYGLIVDWNDKVESFVGGVQGLTRESSRAPIEFLFLDQKNTNIRSIFLKLEEIGKDPDKFEALYSRIVKDVTSEVDLISSKIYYKKATSSDMSAYLELHDRATPTIDTLLELMEPTKLKSLTTALDELLSTLV